MDVTFTFDGGKWYARSDTKTLVVRPAANVWVIDCLADDHDRYASVKFPRTVGVGGFAVWATSSEARAAAKCWLREQDAIERLGG